MGLRPSARKLLELHRSDPRCFYCERVTVRRRTKDGCVPKDDSATLDHYVPLSRGGTNAYWNLVLACWRCNQDKGDVSAEEFICWKARMDMDYKHGIDGLLVGDEVTALRTALPPKDIIRIEAESGMSLEDIGEGVLAGVNMCEPELTFFQRLRLLFCRTHVLCAEGITLKYKMLSGVQHIMSVHDEKAEVPHAGGAEIMYSDTTKERFVWIRSRYGR